MRGPVEELRLFARASLVDPVRQDPVEGAAQLRRRRVVVAATLVVGACVLAWALRIPPGDRLFYLATLLLALVWTTGALASGPLHLGRARTRAGGTARPVVQGLVLGVLVVAVFVVGGLAVAQVPVLRAPVLDLLDHASAGSLTLVALLTAVNSVAEELYFRGAVYAAFPPRTAVWATTLLYTVTVVGAGVPLLLVAAAVLGLVVALQRRVTGGILGPVVTHLVFSLGMLLVLPPVLHAGS